ncbi:nucleoside phosphorylase domain-containing protein [Elsinoe ampelina]|uniref:Nucleoside phosphorylase domain-containing protein n=1 Tax=Elsinoe ampelina TaxID=302913 RepID=A0A6A6GDB6_9PEZI|nr:nucleoside phosphorylase domain-containing protein [Elsinoe ampelina]
MPAAPPRNRSGFDVLIICALPIEADAVEAIFDVYYEGVNDYGAAPDDPNSYATGAIGDHNVVLLRMPGMGSISSASTAANVRLSFPAIRLALVVGIWGAVPHYQSKDIFLGDIIVSRLIVQYDFGRQYPTKFERKTAMEDSFGRPSVRIRSLLATLEGKRKQKMMTDLISTTLKKMQDEDSDYTWPGAATDLSFDASYYHKHRSTCEECQPEDSVGCSVSRSATCDKLACAEYASTKVRRRPEFDGLHRPAIHVGRMGCANTVMKSGHDRDRWASEDSLIGFEMEGAGVWDSYPSLVIKAVCDYADSHKNKAWQVYTTAVAAAAAKALLKEWRPPVEAQAGQDT